MLTATTTVTSKNQITIPVALIRKIDIKKGDILYISEENGVISMQKNNQLLNKYQGFLKAPPHLKGKNIDEIIKQAKIDRFSNKT